MFYHRVSTLSSSFYSNDKTPTSWRKGSNNKWGKVTIYLKLCYYTKIVITALILHVNTAHYLQWWYTLKMYWISKVYSKFHSQIFFNYKICPSYLAIGVMTSPCLCKYIWKGKNCCLWTKCRHIHNSVWITFFLFILQHHICFWMSLTKFQFTTT